MKLKMFHDALLFSSLDQLSYSVILALLRRFSLEPSAISQFSHLISVLGTLMLSNASFFYRSDAQRAAKQKEAKERELEHAAFSADRIEEAGFPMSMVS